MHRKIEGEAEFIAEVEILSDPPPKHIINIFVQLVSAGFNVVLRNYYLAGSTTDVELEAKKDYIKVCWKSGSPNPKVWIRREDKDPNAGGRMWEFIPSTLDYSEHGITDGFLVNVDQFCENPPPTRDPRYVYSKPFQGNGFRVNYTSESCGTTAHYLVQTASIVSLCRIYNGVILEDIDDPKHGAECKWFLMQLALIKTSVKIFVIFDGSKWLETDDSRRIKAYSALKLTMADKALLEAEVSRFSNEVLCGK